MIEFQYIVKSTVVCDVCTTKCEDNTIKCEKKNMETIECDKSTVTCDFRTAQCEYYTIKCEKKISEPPNVRKVHSHVMLVLYNVRMVPSNMGKNKGIAKYDKSTVTCDVGTTQCEDDTIKYEKKKRELPNVTKVLSHVMLVLHIVRMVP